MIAPVRTSSEQFPYADVAASEPYFFKTTVLSIPIHLISMTFANLARNTIRHRSMLNLPLQLSYVSVFYLAH